MTVLDENEILRKSRVRGNAGVAWEGGMGTLIPI